LRFDLRHEQGKIQSFVVQLEYISSTRPIPVVRFDHDPDIHNVEQEGLHMDVFDRRGMKVDVKTNFPVLSLNQYPRWCILYIEKRFETIVRRFEYGN